MGLDPEDNPVEVSIAVFEWGAYLGDEGKQHGIRAKVSSWRRISPQSLVPHSKAGGQYLNSVLAKIESKRGGYEEAILLDERGMVCEGSGENIFVVKDGKIATPPQTASILDGISRKSIIEIAADHGHDDRGARHRPRRADAGRRGVHGRHRRRAGAGARDRRHRDRRRPARSPASSSPRTRTPCTGARLRTRSGWTWCLYHRRRERSAASELRTRASRAGSATSVAIPQQHRKAFTTMAEQVLLYDTTLRDGMQGEGMSLSADEKVRVAHALDSLGVHMIEAGFPSSNPKEIALFEILAGEQLRARRDRRVRHDPPPRRGRRRRRGPARAGRQLRARCARWWARRGRCTWRRSRAWTPRRTCA